MEDGMKQLKGIATTKKIISVMVGTFIVYLGFCFAIKAGVGLDAWDAMLTTTSAVTGIKVGTVSILFSTVCIAGQFFIEKHHFKPIQLLQFLNVFFGGTILNFFVYVLFRNLQFTSYPIRLAVAVFAYILMAFGVMTIMESQLIRNPLEGFCQVLADKYGKRMGRIRQIGDWLFIAAALILSLGFRSEMNIREGTILCMLLFGPALDFLKKPVRSVMDKLSV
jgi:uncharacterized protein